MFQNRQKTDKKLYFCNTYTDNNTNETNKANSDGPSYDLLGRRDFCADGQTLHIRFRPSEQPDLRYISGQQGLHMDLDRKRSGEI